MRRHADLLWALGLAAAALVVYHGVLGAGFVNWDDNRFVTANPLFAAGGWTYVRAALTTVQMEAYHPLHLLAYLPDRYLWHDAAAGFHALNLVLFVADALLLYRLARRVVASPAAAGLATLSFVAHPLAVESVAWISARKDLLALLFFVLALGAEDRREDGARLSYGGLALFAAALLTKTSTVTFPLVLVAWLVCLRGVAWRTALRRAAPYAALAAAAGLGTILVWRDHSMILAARPQPAWLDVPSTLGVYAGRVLWPRPLSAIYAAVPAAAKVLAAGVAVAAVALAATWRRLPGAARFAALAFVATLLPVANLIAIYFRFADRYALLALAVLVPPLAVALAALRWPRYLVALPAIAVLGFAAIAQAATWHDSTALFEQAVRAQPDALFARLKLAETYRDAHRHDDAVAQYQAAIRLDPDGTLGYAGLFYEYAARAEDAGVLPAGSARTWLAALGPALADRAALARLLDTVGRSRCAPCARGLLLLGLRRFPMTDAKLLAAADDALARHQPEEALVYLATVRDVATPEYARLAAAARAALPATTPSTR